MSTIGYRDWQIWMNLDFAHLGQVHGYFEIAVPRFLMSEQTIDMIYEQVDAVRSGRTRINNPELGKYFDPWTDRPKDLVLFKSDNLQPGAANVEAAIRQILLELRAMSLCVDFPLITNRIRFVVPPVQPLHGLVFEAARKPIGRGVAFRIEERGAAVSKLQTEFDDYLHPSDEVSLASHHYLTGITLLGLEDEFTGLIDAAYMQFYQGCEALVGSHMLSHAKKTIARRFSNARDLQIIAHHVWQVRHNYFGHSSAANATMIGNRMRLTFDVAKQVLVARWLCRTMIDLLVPAKSPLVREMRLYHGSGSEEFSGVVSDLHGTFRVNYDHRNVDVFDAAGNCIERYAIG